ncbi:hypothetical protein ACFFGH_29005 [Lysobacter korlensis]|uniref:Transmembrane protein n=1 Tax=Lysobacter korlensis TaxID=553636 RepID=A0ABV6RY31_9GAMM
MSSDSDARRIASGPTPSQLVPDPGGAQFSAASRSGDATPYDPLRLCIFATIALLGWLGGPVTLIVFSVVGFAGYWKAWRGGLKKSKCWLRDTRLVLAYFAVLTAAGVWGTYAVVTSLLRT